MKGKRTGGNSGDPVDNQAFRAALRAFPTGVAVVTTAVADQRCGMTINSFNSVSLDPPMILWSASKLAPSLPLFLEAGRFAVNVLAADQEHLSKRFAAPSDDKFAGVELRYGRTGLPLLEGAAAHFECDLATTYEGGDHLILLGRVVALMQVNEPMPLVFALGGYQRLSVTKAVAGSPAQR
ncbi:flavin reductase family protein [Pseudaminobacter soli (ex Li et al. 2025)]|uniref:Flavin reductase n=1 Tax=Pseudaminobacter soli (ex Li et al. 2025) TaxID=1295366 RepID=A0A2P7S370_9HYPH|nr:flavin reductase family protein [Mesorhizobium soli]PSJ56896.1 flavin reductase [Mesorhizobium soli]